MKGTRSSARLCSLTTSRESEEPVYRCGTTAPVVDHKRKRKTSREYLRPVTSTACNESIHTKAFRDSPYPKTDCNYINSTIRCRRLSFYSRFFTPVSLSLSPIYHLKLLAAVISVETIETINLPHVYPRREKGPMNGFILGRKEAHNHA